MRSGKTIAALALLLALLTGCGPKQPKATTVSQAAQPPSLPPSRMVALLPPVPPPLPATKELPVKLDTTAPPETKTVAVTTEPHRSKKPHTRALTQDSETQKTSSQSAPATQVANAPPAEMTSIGQLSAASDNSNTADRHALSSQIDSTENGLNAIKRPLSSDEQKTAALIRTYITRARDALKADDLDGASNLSLKAHQLLQELTKQ
jgi:hypothetical protein